MNDEEVPAQAKAGARLKQAREAAGYRTAKAFFVEMGVPQSTYSLQESGVRGLTVKTAKSYAEKLGVSVEWLLTGEGDMYPPVPVLGRAGASAGATRHRGFVKQALELFQQLDPGQQSTILQLMRGLVRDGNG